MNLTYPTKILRDAVAVVGPYCKSDKNATNPVYNSLRFVVTDGDTCISARDQSAGIMIDKVIPVGSADPATFLLPYDSLNRILVAASDASQFALTLEGNSAAIKVGRANYTLNLGDPALFADFGDLPEVAQFRVAADDLTLLYDRCNHAIGELTPRLNLDCFQLTVDSDRLSMYATDGRCFVRQTVPIETDLNQSKVLIPAQALTKIIRTVGKKRSSLVTISFGVKFARFSCEDGVKILTQVGVAFPNPASIFTEKPLLWSDEFYSDGILSAINQVEPLIGSELSSVVSFDLTGERAFITSAITERGQARVESETGLPWSHPPDRFHVPFLYLSASLRCLDGMPASIGLLPDHSDRHMVAIRSLGFDEMICLSKPEGVQ